MKTFTVLLLLSQGVPMICAGDEFGRTQNGNNNAWCQDNRTSWLDWSFLETNKDFHRFFKKCIDLRKSHVLFRREDFFPPVDEVVDDQQAVSTVTWQYLTPGVQNWSPDCHGLAFLLSPAADGKQSSDFFVMLNGGREQTLSFKAPEPPSKGRAWYKIINTAAKFPDDVVSLIDAPPHLAKKNIAIPPFGCVVLQSDF